MLFPTQGSVSACCDYRSPCSFACLSARCSVAWQGSNRQRLSRCAPRYSHGSGSQSRSLFDSVATRSGDLNCDEGDIT